MRFIQYLLAVVIGIMIPVTTLAQNREVKGTVLDRLTAKVQVSWDARIPHLRCF